MGEVKLKKCFKCTRILPISEYYKHKKMGDGHLGKCKDCTKKDTKERVEMLMNNPEWLESERERHRDKYYRLNYKEKHKPTKENKRIAHKRFSDKYPEKIKANSATQRLTIKGKHLHHWSYNDEHLKDVIPLLIKDHYKIHRFIRYDKDSKMYKRIDNDVLLDTKSKHKEYINEILTNF